MAPIIATPMSANEIVKPFSLGTPLARMLAAMMLAAIWLPTAPPIVRMTAFMPVATPVWSGRTASTIRFASDAKANPIPIPIRNDAR